MSDAAAPATEEPKKSKKTLILIIAGVLALLVLVVAVVVGTLFAAGVFDKPAVDPQAQMAAGDDDEQADAKGGKADKKEEGKKGEGKEGKKEEGKKGEGKEGKEGGKSKKSPEATKFEYTYYQIEREFLVNLTGSKKVLSTQIAIMTHYDERVVDNVKKHEFALRSVVLDVLRQTTEADLAKPDFRKELAAKVRDAMNDLLEKYEDFGGIEEVMFTSFIVQ